MQAPDDTTISDKRRRRLLIDVLCSFDVSHLLCLLLGAWIGATLILFFS